MLAAAAAVAAALLPGALAPGRRRRGRPVARSPEAAARGSSSGPARDSTASPAPRRPGPFVLPADHGPHFEYQTEWWYYTGNVAAADGRRFGFQLTFFRRGLSPGPPPDGPGLASNQVYFAHFAITDVAGGRHDAAERFSRGAGRTRGRDGRAVRGLARGLEGRVRNRDDLRLPAGAATAGWFA